MEYKTHFNLLLNYDYWANNIVIKTLAENNLMTGKPIELFSHIINAEVLILGRIRNEEFFDPFKVRSIEKNVELMIAINEEWKKFIRTLEENEFDNIINYTNIRGENVSAKIWEMNMHLINHSTYHRGQIATSLRNLNITPPITDFMSYAVLHRE